MTSTSTASALRAQRLSSATASALLCALRPATTTVAPAPARPRAMPRPMPPLPPVTIATLPLRSNGFILAPSPGEALCRQLLAGAGAGGNPLEMVQLLT